MIDKGGRPKHEPTDINKKMVILARGVRMKVEEIAAYIGISRDTLDKYYKEELAHGKVMCDLRVADALMTGIANGDSSLIKYYMNNQMGWADKVNVDSTITIDAMPVPTFNRLIADLATKRPTIDGEVVVQDGPVLPAPVHTEPA